MPAHRRYLDLHVLDLFTAQIIRVVMQNNVGPIGSTLQAAGSADASTAASDDDCLALKKVGSWKRRNGERCRHVGLAVMSRVKDVPHRREHTVRIEAGSIESKER